MIRWLLVLLAFSASAQVSYFNEGFLRQGNAELDRKYIGVASGADATNNDLLISNKLFLIFQSGTNQSLVNATNNDVAVSNALYLQIVASTNSIPNPTNNDLAISNALYQDITSSTNLALQRATNNDLLIGLGATNQSLLMGLNATNEALLIGSNATNESLLIGLNATNQSLLIGANGTNESLLIGSNATNNDTLISQNATNQSTVVSNGLYALVDKRVLTNESRNLVWSSSTNNLGTDVSATAFWGSGAHLTGVGSVTSVAVAGAQGLTSSGGPITSSGTITVGASGIIVTNGEDQAITVSNVFSADATHYLSGVISATTLTNVAGTANTLPIYDAHTPPAISTLANGGTSKYLEGTTPPAYSTPPYLMQAVSGSGNPLASATYHFGSLAAINLTTPAATHPQYCQLKVPFTGHITAVSTHWFVGGTLASAGTVAQWVTNITATTSVALTGVSLAAITADSSDTGLTFAVTAGDQICIRVTTPAWSPTAPTSVFPSAIIVLGK